MQHDFKLVLKRLAYEDSFSRDTHGGGPEHNMHLVPFMIQMINYLLNFNGGFAHANNSSTDKFSYVQERRISEFLD
jgi:E3 ubiquitin-protein ligase UBR4